MKKILILCITSLLLISCTRDYDQQGKIVVHTKDSTLLPLILEVDHEIIDTLFTIASYPGEWPTAGQDGTIVAYVDPGTYHVHVLTDTNETDKHSWTNSALNIGAEEVKHFKIEK